MWRSKVATQSMNLLNMCCCCLPLLLLAAAAADDDDDEDDDDGDDDDRSCATPEIPPPRIRTAPASPMRRRSCRSGCRLCPPPLCQTPSPVGGSRVVGWGWLAVQGECSASGIEGQRRRQLLLLILSGTGGQQLRHAATNAQPPTIASHPALPSLIQPPLCQHYSPSYHSS